MKGSRSTNTLKQIILLIGALTALISAITALITSLQAREKNSHGKEVEQKFYPPISSSNLLATGAPPKGAVEFQNFNVIPVGATVTFIQKPGQKTFNHTVVSDFKGENPVWEITEGQPYRVLKKATTGFRGYPWLQIQPETTNNQAKIGWISWGNKTFGTYPASRDSLKAP